MEGVTGVYEPVQHHWFHCQNPVDCRSSWIPFSREDSLRLEETHKHGETSGEEEVDVVVATEGRRFDVRLKERKCFAVYWEQPPLEVRRCSWFHKGDKDISYTPYPEDTSLVLEEAYMMAVKLNDWMKKIQFPTGETVVLHSPTLMTQQQTIPLKDWISLPSEQSQPRMVKRGLEGIRVELPEGEPDQVDHLVFMVHGIGPTCDIQLRGVVQCVNDFRGASLSLLSSHFKQSQDGTHMGRVEFLPVDWHRVLHGDATGVDEDIQRITLPSISRLRQFSNSTVLDLFFYNSPTYCQTIIDTVASEINRLHQVFLQRHPQFTGEVSLAGHSLGSLILFDLLTNQERRNKDEEGSSVSSPSEATPLDFESFEDTLRNFGLGKYVQMLSKEQMDLESLGLCSETFFKDLGIPLGPRKKIMYLLKRWRGQQESRTGTSHPVPGIPGIAGVYSQVQEHPTLLSGTPSTSPVDYKYFDVGIGQVSIVYPQLAFQPQAFFALGSPIGMFLTVRGLKRIDPKYSLPTCKSFYNIYHPFDPVAYRIEPMVVFPDVDLPPILIPHHKGRKRMHLELKDSLKRVSSDLLLSISTFRGVWQTLTMLPVNTLPPVAGVGTTAALPPQEPEGGRPVCSGAPNGTVSPTEMRNISVGMLNGGRRFDYVLQEKPLESFNEYLFAIQSHLCYWDSKDTVLLLLREIYEGKGILL
ncbi:phospholipase DDHD2-like isoform X1 [Oncorhynchus nerka]|uniref:phospholipase DDHD2-like isoform X1 n=1 Tax=Oncorhynchus nerka TaxID=8023 RepID=UPI0011312BC4|nr:phospholipase DDHD2-like isoform X1 [Oncorhynchus nerka]XP_029536706.1 phospholipase DDHD2-like isoform X1 [Oncorhynchus nerka]XP_029536715.1 phospholipase DDHD2-like isoform X1 [Oncorhynchus nerka]